MAKKDNENEGPTCACGRVDIYKEMLKHEKNEKKVKNESSNGVDDSPDSNSNLSK